MVGIRVDIAFSVVHIFCCFPFNFARLFNNNLSKSKRHIMRSKRQKERKKKSLIHIPVIILFVICCWKCVGSFHFSFPSNVLFEILHLNRFEFNKYLIKLKFLNYFLVFFFHFELYKSKAKRNTSLQFR